jgi:glyoxylase-like metal-dependent hydrolase (beta-lactamase superfamily II)
MASTGFGDIVMRSVTEPVVQWQIGDVTVTRVVETELQRTLSASLPNADPDAVARLSWLDGGEYAVTDGLLTFSFHSFVIETPGRVLIVDTCFGNDKTRPRMGYCDNLQLPFLARLDGAGYTRDAVDTVICTHFHNDHVGWNTMRVGAAWEPTFPRARYLFNRDEIGYWTDTLAAGGGDDIGDSMSMAFADSIAPVLTAGLVDLVEPGTRVCDEVRLIATPGHTPGHVGVVIESRGQYGFITGDAIHHPLQLANPAWSSGFDYDDAQAITSRTAILDAAVETDALLLGTHWTGQTPPRIARDGDSYRLKV